MAGEENHISPRDIITLTTQGHSGPNVAYTETCRWTGYGFWPVLCPEQGI